MLLINNKNGIISFNSYYYNLQKYGVYYKVLYYNVIKFLTFRTQIKITIIRTVDTPKFETVSLIIKFTNYDKKKVYLKV
jgi:hypothetical protein